MMSLPMALQSGTSAEARNSVQLAQCVLESYENLKETSVVSSVPIDDCIAESSIFMYWFSKWANCPQDPDCDSDKQQYYEDMMNQAEIYLLLCIVMT
jgi:hypothetical protein